MQPNWPSDDDPDYTPDFGDGDDESLEFVDASEPDLEDLREDLRDLVDEQ